MDNELLNGILLSYSRLLKEIESIKDDINALSNKIAQNNNIPSQVLPTPTSLPKPIKKTVKVKTLKIIEDNFMKECEDEI